MKVIYEFELVGTALMARKIVEEGGGDSEFIEVCDRLVKTAAAMTLLHPRFIGMDEDKDKVDTAVAIALLIGGLIAANPRLRRQADDVLASYIDYIGGRG